MGMLLRMDVLPTESLVKNPFEAAPVTPVPVSTPSRHALLYFDKMQPRMMLLQSLTCDFIHMYYKHATTTSSLPPLTSTSEQTILTTLGKKRTMLTLQTPECFKRRSDLTAWKKRDKDLLERITKTPDATPPVTLQDPAKIFTDNKTNIKRYALAALRLAGISRKHTEFDRYWSQLYKGVQFTLRNELDSVPISTQEVQQTVDGYLTFLFSNKKNK
jgi:hypothetical protein